MGTNTNKSTLQLQAEDLAANLTGVLPANAKIPYSGNNLTPAQVVSQLNDGLTTITDAATAKADYATAVAAKKGAVATMKPLVTAVEAYLRVMIPTDVAGLASCGVAPKKTRPKLTSAEKAASAAQAQVTREANNVMGTAQKRKAAKAAKATTVVLGPDGQPLDGSTLPSAPAGANAAAAGSSPAASTAPVSK